LNQNRESEINNAFLQGLIGLAAIFFILNEIEVISKINEIHFLRLSGLFVVVSLIRVHGIILEIEKLVDLSYDIFIVWLIPYEIFVATRIVFTRILPNEAMFNFVPTYSFAFVLGYMFSKLYNIELNINLQGLIKSIKSNIKFTFRKRNK
jgi:hypothetical protein